MDDIDITPAVEKALWREDFDRVCSGIHEQLKHLQNPSELVQMAGPDWYHLNSLLCIASDAVWLARDQIEFGLRPPSLR